MERGTSEAGDDWPLEDQLASGARRDDGLDQLSEGDRGHAELQKQKLEPLKYTRWPRDAPVHNGGSRCLCM
jgi:hypothetical protein